MTTIHLVTHTHWDREWYQTFQQFRLRLVHLVDHLLTILATDPDFKFFMLDGQTIVLDDYLQLRPERREELRQHVQSGRILVGPWYVLPDEFLVSPEAIVRNLLQGERTARAFGNKMMIGYIPDPFGHIGQMPQILHGFGIETASLWRGVADQPAEFWWQAPDGTKVFMAYLVQGYGNAASLPAFAPEQFTSEVCRLRDELVPQSATKTYALLMHGSDHVVPPASTSAAVAYANDHLDGDVLLHSTLPAYVAAVRGKIQSMDVSLPTVSGELRACKTAHLLPGVLSTRMWIKQRNQECETLLEKWAEPFSTWAELACEQPLLAPDDPGSNVSQVKDPAQILRYAWRLLMENHPHDSICGCSIDQVHDEMRPRFDQAEQVAEAITRQSLDRLAAAVDTRAEGRTSAIVVFNPASGVRTDWVTVEAEAPSGKSAFEIVDQHGNIQPIEYEGLPPREMGNMAVDKKEMQSILGMVHEGRIGGMVFRDFIVKRQGDTVRIDSTIADTGEPDLVVWERGQQAMKELLADPEVTTFKLVVRSVPSNRISFVARDVPGLGYCTYWIRPKEVEDAQPAEPVRLNRLARLVMPVVGKLASNPRLTQRFNLPKIEQQAEIENEFFSLSASPMDGTLTLCDKRSGALFTGLNRFIDGGDCGDEYNYCPPVTDSLVSKPRVRRLEVKRGELRQTIEIDLLLTVPQALATDRKTRSTGTIDLPITTTINLTTGVPRVDVHTEVDNRARDHRLRVHFLAPFSTQCADYDGHFEIVCRLLTLPAYDDTWVEQPRPEKPQRAFISVNNDQIALTIANRGLPEAEALNVADGQVELALTLLRCVGWLSRGDLTTRKGNAGPGEETPAAQMPGKHAFDYAILPQPDCVPAFEQAYAFQSSLRAVNTPLHAGTLQKATALVQVTPPEFAISAVKTAEDGNGWILRGYNLTDQPLDVKLVPWRPFTHVETTNLVEETLDVLIPAEDGSVSLPVGGRSIATVRFT